MSDISSPPAHGEFYDLAATVANCLARLRLQGGDVDSGRLTALVPAAALDVSSYCDREEVLDGPPAEPDIQNALEVRTIELYRADIPVPALGAPFAAVGAAATFDALIPHRRQRWGVA